MDPGAGVSLLKPDNLGMTRKFNPDGRVNANNVDGSIIETLGTVETVVNAKPLKIPFTFQPVSKQVDIACDEILGKDFLENAGAKICYVSGTTLGTGGSKISKTLSPVNAGSQNRRIRRLMLPSRIELMVGIP